MDCDKLDEMAMDLVDPEGAGLDPRALGRAREDAETHVASCPRCAALVARLRAGLRAADELPLDEPSSLLESRILAAAALARPRPAWPRRVARAVSTAGGWAMRPQVAMAAVLVLMVGTSILVLRGGGLPTARRTKVTDEGAPVATLEPPVLGSAGPALPQEGAPAVLPGGAKDKAATPKKDSPAPPAEEKKSEALEAEPAEPTDLPKATGKADLDDLAASGGGAPADGKSKGAGLGGIPSPQQAPQAAAPAPAPAPTMPVPAAPAPDLGPPLAEAETAKPSKKSATASAPGGTAASSTFDDAMTAYKESRWAVAAKGFDAAAAQGARPATSLLYAARSHRALGDCGNALTRYKKVLQSYSASPEAPTSALEGGRCAKAIGNLAEAHSLFERAKAWPATKKEAEAELAALAKPPPPPAKAKAAKPSAAADDAY